LKRGNENGVRAIVAGNEAGMLSGRKLGAESELSIKLEQSVHKLGLLESRFSQSIGPAQHLQIRGCMDCRVKVC
jgi:hypothetical protein